jgi:tight adherence protein B
MLRRLSVLLTALFVASLALPLAAVAQQPGAFDLTIRETRLATDGVTEVVVNVTGDGVPDVLNADAFAVSEQGQPVEDLQVEPFLESAGADVVVALAIDVSGSMDGEPMEVTRAAAADLVRTLTGAGVRVQLLSFGSTVEVLTPATADTDVVVDAVQGLQAAGTTLLYDAVVEASEQLSQVAGQRNLVIFSDGGDNGSEGTLEEAIAAANEAEAPITAVALDTFDLDPEALDAMASQTDGVVLTAENVEELEAVFDAVARDIASQYILRYTSTRLEPSSLDLSVSVTAAAGSASTTFTVVNVREAQPVGPRIIDPEPGPFGNPLVLYALIAAAFVALLLLFVFLFTGARTRADKVLGDQLARYIEGGDARAGRSSLVAAHFRDRALELFDSGPRPRGWDEKLSLRLEQANWPLRNGEFAAMVVLGGLGVTLLFSIVFNVLGGLLVGLIAASVPFLILSQRRAKRHDAFLRALPDTLQLLAGSLRAGYGVLQAIDSVAKESEGVVAQEFGRVLTEARLGMPLEHALEDMATRIDNDDFRWVVLAINIQREVGGNLAELLDTVAEVLREREMLRRQIKVLSAEGRLSAIILVGLPIFLAIYLILVRPEYISVLVTSGLFGWILVGGAVFLMLVGVIWIRNLIRIEV